MIKRKVSLQARIEETIQRALNDRNVKGVEKYKWTLAGIKFEQMKKQVGTDAHGTGFDTIDDPDLDDTEDMGADGNDGDAGAGEGDRD